MRCRCSGDSMNGYQRCWECCWIRRIEEQELAEECCQDRWKWVTPGTCSQWGGIVSVPRKERWERAPANYKGESQSWQDYWKTSREIACWNVWSEVGGNTGTVTGAKMMTLVKIVLQVEAVAERERPLKWPRGALLLWEAKRFKPAAQWGDWQVRSIKKCTGDMVSNQTEQAPNPEGSGSAIMQEVNFGTEVSQGEQVRWLPLEDGEEARGLPERHELQDPPQATLVRRPPRSLDVIVIFKLWDGPRYVLKKLWTQ